MFKNQYDGATLKPVALSVGFNFVEYAMFHEENILEYQNKLKTQRNAYSSSVQQKGHAWARRGVTNWLVSEPPSNCHTWQSFFWGGGGGGLL